MTVLTIQPADSKVKAVTVHVTGTSRVSVASTQSRDGRTFMVQRDTEAKALAEKQKITAIYAVMGNERVLLSADHGSGGGTSRIKPQVLAALHMPAKRQA